MQLHKRSGNGIYELKYLSPVTGNSSRVSTGKRRRADAEIWAKMFASQNALTDSREVHHTLSQSLWDTYRRIWSKQKGHKSTYAKISLLDKKVGNWRLSNINYESLHSWIAAEERTDRKPQTVGRDINLISKTLHEAWRLNWILAVPPMPTCKPAATIERYVTFDEEDLLVECARALIPRKWMDLMTHAIPFFCDTGLRVSELLEINPTAHLTRIGAQPALRLPGSITKSGQARTVPLTLKAFDHLQCILANEDWVQRRPTQTMLSQTFGYIRDLADLPDVHLHILRHTCASRLVQAGEDLYRIKTWLGHSDIKVTERYAHLKPDHLMSSVSLLER